MSRGVRVEPHTSLSVRLIHEATYGPDRFEPVGPVTRHPIPVGHAHPALVCRNADGDCYEQGGTMVTLLQRPYPADVHGCGERDATEDRVLERVREVVVPSILASHLVGSLLDTLA